MFAFGVGTSNSRGESEPRLGTSAITTVSISSHRTAKLSSGVRTVQPVESMVTRNLISAWRRKWMPSHRLTGAPGTQ